MRRPNMGASRGELWNVQGSVERHSTHFTPKIIDGCQYSDQLLYHAVPQRQKECSKQQIA